MSECQFKIGDFDSTVVGLPKILDRRGCATNHSSSQKTRLNNLLYGIKIWTDLSFVLSQFTVLTDRQTDTFLATRLSCIQCSTVKTIIC